MRGQRKKTKTKKWSSQDSKKPRTLTAATNTPKQHVKRKFIVGIETKTHCQSKKRMKKNRCAFRVSNTKNVITRRKPDNPSFVNMYRNI